MTVYLVRIDGDSDIVIAPDIPRAIEAWASAECGIEEDIIGIDVMGEVSVTYKYND